MLRLEATATNNPRLRLEATATKNPSCCGWKPQLHISIIRLRVDFEIADALKKLERAGIAGVADGRYRALPIDAAQDQLDVMWEQYTRADPRTAGEPAWAL